MLKNTPPAVLGVTNWGGWGGALSKCWPKKNLAKSGHPKMAKTFGQLAKKKNTFWAQD